jgi:hypothetical protein
MIGTLGMNTSVFPAGVSGLKNRFADVGFDAQYELPTSEGKGAVTAHALWLHERNTLNTVRLDASVYSAARLGLTLGYFSTSGTTDLLRYPEGSVGGSATGSPNSNGLVVELSALPWLNTRFELQYVLYNKFNGAGTNYDGAGRNAKDNNTLYLLSWLAF